MVLKFLGLLVSEAANIQKIFSTTALAKYRGIDSLHDVRPWQILQCHVITCERRVEKEKQDIGLEQNV
jgi:hypothetical protein